MRIFILEPTLEPSEFRNYLLDPSKYLVFLLKLWKATAGSRGLVDDHPQGSIDQHARQLYRQTKMMVLTHSQ